MVFAIDIGNTNIVIGCFEDKKIIFTERLSTKKTATALEYAISFKNVLELYEIDINKIGCMGNSGGGTATYYAACMEER